MKKILLLTFAVLLTAPCFAQKTYFAGIALHTVESQQGVDIYQNILSKDRNNQIQGAFTLTVGEEENQENAFTFDMFFWPDLYQRDEDGTYRQVRELTYNNNTFGKLDAYLARTYYLANDNESADTAIFEIKRAKEMDGITRFYTFTFEQKLQGEDVLFQDKTGAQHALSPKDYFEYMTQHFEKRWIYEINHLILPVFNK